MNILATPVHTDREDSVAWHFDNKGVFSVKSAYQVLEYETEIARVRQRGESSFSFNRQRQENLRNEIWKIPRPPKIKQFLWRVAHNSLAFKLNIRRRRVRLDTMSGVFPL